MTRGRPVSQFTEDERFTDDALIPFISPGSTDKQHFVRGPNLLADLAERARDAIGAALTEGDGVTITVDDTANTITISLTPSSWVPLPELSIAEGATTPVPEDPRAVVWSTGIVPAGAMVWDGTSWTRLNRTQVQTFTRSGTLTAPYSGVHRFKAQRAMTIVSVIASVTLAPNGGTVIVDVNVDGVTLFTNQAGRPTIASGEFESASVVPDVVEIPAGSYLTVDVDHVGAVFAGANLTLQIEYL